MNANLFVGVCVVYVSVRGLYVVHSMSMASETNFQKIK